ncbi:MULTISPECIES: IS66 family insertion sequence element accessory protein TnpB [Anaerovoracaceae]
MDSLTAIVQNCFELDHYEQGNLFLFCGRWTDQIKGILYEGDRFLFLDK